MNLQGKVIAFMTPAHRVGDLEVSKDPSNGSDSKPLYAYVDVIKDKGIKHQIPVLDLYSDLGIDPNVKEDREKYAPDGLHLNDAGHRVLARCLMDFLQKLQQV